MKHNLIFGLVYGRPAVLKISAIKLKYVTFKDMLCLCFHGQRNEKIDFKYTALQRPH